MNRLLLLFILLLCLSGCGLFKRATKSSHKEKTQTERTVDSTGTKTDKTVIVEKESVDTTVNTPEERITTDTKIDYSDLIYGLTVLDTGLVSIKIQYDTLSKHLKSVVTLKKRSIPVKFERSRTTYKDIQETSHKAAKEKRSAVIKDGKKVKEPAKMGIWFIGFGIALIVVAGLLIYFLRKRV